MNAPILNPAAPSFLAILDSVGCDTGRAIRKVSASEGPNTAWLRSQGDIASRLVADMRAEFAAEDERQGRVS